MAMLKLKYLVITILVKRINNIYGIYVKNNGYYDADGDYWFGANKPYESKASDVWLTEETGETYMVAKENRIIVVQDEKPTDLKKDDIWL